MSIYITADTHGEVIKIINALDEGIITPDDILVILGDAGFNLRGIMNGDRTLKSVIKRKKLTLFCIHGNHEMRPETLPFYKTQTWHGGTVYIEEEYPNILFAKDGEIFDLDGRKTIVIGGAYSADKNSNSIEKRKPYFPDEQPSDETKAFVESVLEKEGWKIDQVMTHTCPYKYIPKEAFLPGIDQDSVDHSTEEWLDSIEDKLTYNRWLCGHWHIDKSIDKMRFVMNDIIR